MRPSDRTPDLLRPVVLETGVNRYAEGSCLASFGHTKVLVTASVEERVPGFMRGRGVGGGVTWRGTPLRVWLSGRGAGGAVGLEGRRPGSLLSSGAASSQ